MRTAQRAIFPFDAFCACDLQLRGPGDLLKNARHAEKNVGTNLEEVLTQLLNIARKIDGVSHREREMDRDHALGDMRQRKIREHAVSFRHLPKLLDEARLSRSTRRG